MKIIICVFVFICTLQASAQKNKQVIQQLLEEFGKCFDSDKDRYKQAELMELVKLLD